MSENESMLAITSMIVVTAFGLQAWTVLRTARQLSDRLPLTLFAAALALAARSGAELSGLIETPMTGEIVVLAASAAILAASYVHRPAATDVNRFAALVVGETPKPIMVKRASGEYEYVNRAFENAFGKTNAEMVGRTATDIWDDHLSLAAIAADRNVIATGEPSTHEVEFNLPGQAPTDWLLMKFPLPMPDGEICIATVYTDFSEYVALEKRLAESEARIHTLLDNSPAPIYFKDKDLRYVMANRRYLEVYGMTLDDILGKTSLEIFAGNQGAEFTAHDREILEKGTLITHEEVINEATFLTTKFPVTDGRGELIGVGGIETDITDRVTVEEAYREARDDAETANRAKSAFLANMSHELRTPLNSIIGFSDSLLVGTLGKVENPLHREYLEIIRTGGEHLLQLINDILDLSRIEAGKLVLEEHEIDLYVVLNDAILLTAERAGAEGIYIDNRVARDNLKIIADERQLLQVLINLLSNAVKFTDGGGKITTSARRTDDGGLEISITDTGVGIAPEHLAHVQQPFVQVADAFTRKHQGSGLGLAIVRSIVGLHDGTFALESAVNKGTTAKITLPADRVIPAQD